MLRLLILLLLCAPLTGCYYMQAAKGQWEVIRKREPVEDVIENPATSTELAGRLRLLSEARDFSVATMGLPDNESYRNYADLEREYVVWNVFAAPEFSLTPKQWCFPVAGCVSYRGYFSKDAARRKSEQLASDGFDVVVGGVAAYSTLGRFSDPILNTMMRWGDTELAAVLFHELAHQVVYVKDDSAFNESFATAVEEFGVRLWLESRGEQQAMADYIAARELQQSLTELVAIARVALGVVYESDIDVAHKRAEKRARLIMLAEDIAAELQRNGRDESAWWGGELNNAHLISTTLYEGWLPSFRALFRQCKQRFDCFYSAAQALADLDRSERDAALSASDLLYFGRGVNEQ